MLTHATNSNLFCSQIEIEHSAKLINFLRSMITPLMNASYNGQLEVVKILIKAGATLSKTNMCVP
jgi:hypothetical protein